MKNDSIIKKKKVNIGLKGVKNLINSNYRKQSLCGWLKETNPEEYNSHLKLQKFLFFYECFSKIEGEKADFDHLKGYKRGPVFSSVFGDYRKEKQSFDQESQKSYESRKDNINHIRAEKCAFLIKVLSEQDLSDLTHRMNIWKCKENRIMNGESQVSLSEEDFSKSDEKLIQMLDCMYPIEFIRQSVVITINNYNFVLKKEDLANLTEEHYDTLSLMTENVELHNPVYVEIDEEGRLIVD